MTTDAVLNIVLSTILPGVMAILGVVMALRQSDSMSKSERRIWISVFSLLFLISIPLAVWKEIESTRQQKAFEQRALQSEQNRISDTQYMKGKLDAVATVLGTIAERSPMDVASLAKGLAAFARESPQETARRRRVELQIKLGDLVAEGERLLDGCFSRASIPDKLVAEVVDWQGKARATVAGNLDPSRLTDLGYQSPASERGNPSRFCEELDHAVRGLQTVLWKEFSKDSKK